MQDLQEFTVAVEASVSVDALGARIHACGPWTQGPVLLQMLKILAGIDVAGLGHNSVSYIHTLVEAMKLAFADRETYYADPRFGDVPLDRLLSDDYAKSRRALIDVEHAVIDVMAGDPHGGAVLRETARAQMDTSYACAIDGEGNAFSATPQRRLVRHPDHSRHRSRSLGEGLPVMGRRRSPARGRPRNSATPDP